MKIKYLMIILSILPIMALSSCKKIEKITVIEEVKNYQIDVEDGITLSTVEDALVSSISIAEQSVVGIICKTNKIIFSSEVFGSGVIIKRTMENTHPSTYAYYVVTNRHVVTNDNYNVLPDISIYMDNNTISAECVYIDEQIDMALLKFSSMQYFTTAKIGSSSSLSKGRYVIAIGNPYDLREFYRTATVGNVSHPNREYEEETIKGNKCYNWYIQHDAAINSGNSGGGLFNLNGELVGLNTWKLVGNDNEAIEGLGFAIPINNIMINIDKYFASLK